jgi:trk system potassium uptake protein
LQKQAKLRELKDILNKMRNTIFNILAYIFLCMGFFMLIPALVSYIYDKELIIMFLSIAIVLFVIGGVLLLLFRKSSSLNFKGVIVTVFFGWLSISFLGALPYYFSGYVPFFIDALFESISGFTTTGASIFVDVEILPMSLLFWRSFTQWLGGIGIVVFVIAVIPSFGLQANHLFQSEVSGGTINNRILPRIRSTALLLLGVYFSLTLLQIILLYLANVNLFESILHTFATVSTGGFSNYNASIANYTSPLVQYIIIVFMILSGVNFILYSRFILGDRTIFFKNQEFKFYLFIILLFTLIITYNIWGTVFSSLEEAFRMALFQVASITTTTGFVTADYDLWPNLSRTFLFSLMFVGGCIGSTASSMKVFRTIILLKSVRNELLRILHPGIVDNLKIENEPVAKKTIIRVLKFIIVYIFIFMMGTLVMSMFGLDMDSSLTASAATLGNVGPGLGAVGPTMNYEFLQPLAKLFLSFLMIIGRLEIFTVLVIFMPEFWKD